MYTIGEFSKISKLTAKTLRYYDHEGLLKPSARGENGYRYYAVHDLEKAELILLLKQFDFTIAEMKEVLAYDLEETDLAEYLVEKRQKLVEKVTKQQELIRQLDAFLNKTQTRERKQMSYQMTVEQLPAKNVALWYFEGTFKDIGKYTGKLFQEVKGRANGAPFCLYFDEEVKAVGKMALGVPIKKTFSSDNVKMTTFPAGKALCTTHIGEYDRLHEAYKALIDYAKEHHLTLDTPWREEYVKGPGKLFKGNPESYQTKIIVPIKA
ncbi:MerR family transcriptional regulator [Enterococcus florum]|uniref:MerR family transcriptional regulator n=1 Tax=Enterococcus florum TaxID=2480627 RepID=A0A4P5P5S0_9ENTE|nr:MerR family transcriptional regulator [Enterococcus florum]GCF93207.1 MerR family transcriptional regulator [Enterococcus florum]